jgi:hypothetical protein
VIRKVLLVVATISLAVAGCKQGLGQRCQVQSDCADNLVCNEGTQECSTGTGSGLDAGLPVDAMHDASVIVIDSSVQ